MSHHEINSALKEYATSASRFFSEMRQATTQLGNLRLLRNQTLMLLEAVTHLEQSVEFSNLTKAIFSTFHTPDEQERIFLGLYKSDLGVLLRQSGWYQDLFEDRPPNPTAVVELIQDAFGGTECTTTYLAPLEFVQFGMDRIELVGYQICRYSKNELDCLLKQSVSGVFYPRAVVDTAILSDYWFVSIKRPGRSGILSGRDLLYHQGRVKVEYSTFPPEFESVMRQLVLYDWRDPYLVDSDTKRKKGFAKYEEFPRFWVPFVIEINDSPTDLPPRAPDISALATQPVFDPETGEELYEEPASGFSLDSEETKAFQKFMCEKAAMLAAIRECTTTWRFFETAHGFLVKAFLSEGFEQLLWHVTVIEALLGEKIEGGLTNLLKRRIGTVNGKNEAEQKQIRKNFDDLYQLRSSLVHGSPDIGDKEIYLGHLSEARRLARGTTLWMLHLLYHVLQTIRRTGCPIPTRDDLFAMIQIDQERHGSAAEVLRGLPAGFPQVPQWYL